MPGMDGLHALQQIKQREPHLPVIVMTGQGTMETAIEATKRGAYDYQLKPFEPTEMLRVIDQALESARITKGRVAIDPQHALPAGDAMVGHSAAMQEVYKAIGRVAPTDATVLIDGESGTGKELVARAVYQHSRRSDRPFLVVNCVAIPETLLEGELFGHEPGAFTGARGRRIGKFEQADGGTIFLDEIGDVSPGIQAKILRVLQERSFQRLGGNDTIRVDVRVLAATNRNIERAIADGTFRQDLYHRLNVVSIHIPPLRDRRQDIPALVDYFLERFARELQVAKPPLADEALELLTKHAWPGNVRELEHAILRAMIFTRGYPIQPSHLSLTPQTAAPTPRLPGQSVEPGRLEELVRSHLDSHSGAGTYEQFVENVERALLAEALRRTQGNQSHAARILGLPRPTLHAKVQKLRPHGKDSAPLG
jgi:DNA-binding NtrC family response regulator